MHNSHHHKLRISLRSLVKPAGHGTIVTLEDIRTGKLNKIYFIELYSSTLQFLGAFIFPAVKFNLSHFGLVLA